MVLVVELPVIYRILYPELLLACPWWAVWQPSMTYFLRLSCTTVALAAFKLSAVDSRSTVFIPRECSWLGTLCLLTIWVWLSSSWLLVVGVPDLVVPCGGHACFQSDSWVWRWRLLHPTELLIKHMWDFDGAVHRDLVGHGCYDLEHTCHLPCSDGLGLSLLCDFWGFPRLPGILRVTLWTEMSNHVALLAIFLECSAGILPLFLAWTVVGPAAVVAGLEHDLGNLALPPFERDFRTFSRFLCFRVSLRVFSSPASTSSLISLSSRPLTILNLVRWLA